MPFFALHPRVDLPSRIYIIILKQLSVSVLWAAVGTVAALASPLAYAHIVAAIIDPASPPSRLTRAVAMLGTSYAVEPVATYLYVKVMSGVIDRAATRLKLQAFRSLLSQEVAFFDLAGSSKVSAYGGEKADVGRGRGEGTNNDERNDAAFLP